MANKDVPRHCDPRHLTGERKLDVALRRNDEATVGTGDNRPRLFRCADGDNGSDNRLACASIDDTTSCTNMISERSREYAAGEEQSDG